MQCNDAIEAVLAILLALPTDQDRDLVFDAIFAKFCQRCGATLTNDPACPKCLTSRR